MVYVAPTFLKSSPGRFFAVAEIKMLLAFTLLRYDIKTRNGNRPPDINFDNMILPNSGAEILYRKRSTLSES